MTNNNISQPISLVIFSQTFLRMALGLALLLGVSITSVAQKDSPTDWTQTSTWDGSDSPTPSGGTTLRPKSLVDPSIDTTVPANAAGSATNPYLIESAADLKYLQKTTSLYGKCFEQMVDIDLDGKVLGTIGSSDNGNKPFTGKYDGRGHKIMNLRVEWNTISNVACGLFGYLRGEVRNLVIDNAQVTRGDDATETDIDDTDFKIGVLAGCVAPDGLDKPAVIENISIINSKIDDGGKTSNIKAALIGGLVGDISNGFGGTHRMDKYGKVKINNIYCEVEIDLTNYTPYSSNAYQLNVGGIFGRMRRGLERDLPTNTIFTGKIKAPNGMVGPIFGASRSDNGNNEQGMMLFYAGQVTPEGETIDEPLTYHFINEKTFNDTNLFYDYKLWDGSTFVDVDDSTPSVVTTLPEHTQSGITREASFRSFAAPSATSKANTAAAIGMKKFQGVNKGGLLAGAAAAETVLSGIDFDTNGTYKWSLNTSTKDATISENTPATHSLAAEHTAWNKFTATLTAGTDDGFHYRWFAVDLKGNRTEIGLSESSVMEGTYPVPADAVELIVFLCKANDDYYLDKGHYVYAFCLPKYKFEALEVITSAAEDKVRNVLTPKLKIKDLATDETIETTSFDGWEFEVKVYSGNTVKYTFPDKFAGAEVPYTILPTVSSAATVQLVGTRNGLSFTTGKVAFPHYLRGSTSTGWVREKSVDGQRFTLTFGNATLEKYKDSNGKEQTRDAIGDKVYFSNSPEEDWGVTPTWDIGTYYTKNDVTYSEIQPKNWTESEERTENGQYKCWVKDLAANNRYYRLKLMDSYGFSDEQLLRYGDAWIESAHTNLRYIEKLDGLQQYHFKMQFANGTYVGSDGKTHDNPYITINPDMYDHFTWTYSVEGVADEQNLELSVSNGDFSIQNIYLKPRTYVFTYKDQYKQSKEYKEKLTFNAPEAELVIANGKVHPELTIEGSKYFIKQADGRGLFYNWTVTLLDENDAQIGVQWTYTGDELPAQTITSTTKKVKVELVITDCKGDTKTVEETYSIDNLRVEVSKTGTAPNCTYTASLCAASGFPLEADSWQWYGLNKETFEYYKAEAGNYDQLTGASASTNSIAQADFSGYSTFYAVCNFDGSSAAAYCAASKNIVYVYNKDKTNTPNATFTRYRYEALLALDYPDGDDGNNGRTPETAVKTMARAYELLTADAGVDENIIVIMGFVDDLEFVKKLESEEELKAHSAAYNKNVTITGDPSYFSGTGPNGTLCMMPVARADSYKALGGATKFKKLTWYSRNRSHGNMLYFVCRLYDLTIGEDVVMENFAVFQQGYGQIKDTRMSAITLVCGYNNADYLADQIETPKANAIPGVTTITIQSGGIGRIIGANRNSASHSVTHNILGSPTKPIRTRVILEIPENQVTTCYDADTKKMEELDYQIGVLVGGQTDGTVYGDVDITLKHGIVGRLVTGNISFGRLAGNYPGDGFFGSTVFNCEGGNVYEMIGGTLGRCDASGSYKTPEAYFYGRSVINISGGTLHGNVYVGGSGGTTGLGTNEKHTDDTHIPYYKNGTLRYGNYETATATGSTLPTMVSFDYDEHGNVIKSTNVDFAHSICELNISGGTIKGDVFGGGFGYSDNIDDINKTPKQPGYLFGDTYVKMTGGTVEGSLYGGSAGSDGFYNLSEVDGVYDENYRKVGQVVGNTYVEVTSGTIKGDVCGGSRGVKGFHEMATIYGNTEVVIGDWQTDEEDKVTIGGNVFGGGALAAVEGDTKLTIRNCGTEIGSVDDDGKLTGGYVYGGGDAAPAFSTETTIWGGKIKGNVFGGGNGTDLEKNENGAQVGYAHDDTTPGGTGNAVTNIYGGTIGTWTIDADGNESCLEKTGGVFGGSNTNGNIRGGITLVADKREETIDNITYGSCDDFKLYEMYGAGNKADYDGTGGITFKLLCVGALDYIYGGAKDANYKGDINLTLTSGTYKGVYGGNNLGGVVTGNIVVNIDETGCKPIIIDKVYGGGRDAKYAGSPVVNVYSCTRIGEVYGGGCGEHEEKDATVTGNPVVNILQIPGKYDPDKALQTTPVYDDTNKTKLGYIGNVFGGGEYARVVGNTTVNIATQATKQKHQDTTLDDDEYDVGANITGNVFGGGNEADVTGKTKVEIGNKE